MMMQEHAVASKYAKAFLNVFIDELSLDDYKKLVILAQFLKDRREVVAFLHVPTIDSGIKQNALVSVIKKFSLPDCFNRLIQILVKSRRAFLFPLILLDIARLYRIRKNIEDFVIESSCQLDSVVLKTIEQFLSQKTGSKILSHHTIDKNLIAGIRLKSERYVWEYSVAKKLRMLSLSRLEQEFYDGH